MLPPVIPNPLPGLYGKGKRTGPYKDRQWISVSPLTQELLAWYPGEWVVRENSRQLVLYAYRQGGAYFSWEAATGTFDVGVISESLPDLRGLKDRLRRVIAPVGKWDDSWGVGARYGGTEDEGFIAYLGIELPWEGGHELTLCIRPDPGVIVPITAPLHGGEVTKLMVAGRKRFVDPQEV